MMVFIHIRVKEQMQMDTDLKEQQEEHTRY